MADEARPRPIEDVREISAITYGFMASKALFAALEFDLFTHIARGAVSTSALARASGIAENRLVTLLATLKSLGLISEAGGRLVNAPATARYLVAGAPGDFRDYVRFVNGEFGYESFRHLGAALRGERIFPDKGFYEGMIYTRESAASGSVPRNIPGRSGLHACSRSGSISKIATSFLDVGGGSGAYSIAFCAANPHLQATILDFPETVDTARRYVQEAGLSDRIAHLAGNAIKVEWPGGHDVVLMSYVWSAVGEADLAILAKRAADAMPPGGRVLIHDFVVDDARQGPPFAAWYLLGGMFDNPTAVCLTPAYVERILRDAGFAIEGTETMLPGITMLTRASKLA